MDKTDTTNKTTLLKLIYDSLIKNYKEKLSKLTKNQNPNVSDINKIAEYISIIQYIYSHSNCSNRLSMTDLISKMKTSNKFNKLNDSYIEYIMYKRENYGKVIKYLNKISNNFIESLSSIIENLPECSSNQSSRPSNQSSRPSNQSSRPSNQSSRPSNQSSRPSVVNPPYNRFPVYTGNPPYVSYA